MKYSPDKVLTLKADPNFSVGRSPRFRLPIAEVNLKSQLPLNYSEKVINEDKDTYKKVGLGYGKKFTYRITKEDEDGPGPIYKTDYLKSMKYLQD